MTLPWPPMPKSSQKFQITMHKRDTMFTQGKPTWGKAQQPSSQRNIQFNRRYIKDKVKVTLTSKMLSTTHPRDAKSSLLHLSTKILFDQLSQGQQDCPPKTLIIFLSHPDKGIYNIDLKFCLNSKVLALFHRQQSLKFRPLCTESNHRYFTLFHREITTGNLALSQIFTTRNSALLTEIMPQGTQPSHRDYTTGISDCHRRNLYLQFGWLLLFYVIEISDFFTYLAGFSSFVWPSSLVLLRLKLEIYMFCVWIKRCLWKEDKSLIYMHWKGFNWMSIGAEPT